MESRRSILSWSMKTSSDAPSSPQCPAAYHSTSIDPRADRIAGLTQGARPTVTNGFSVAPRRRVLSAAFISSHRHRPGSATSTPTSTSRTGTEPWTARYLSTPCFAGSAAMEPVSTSRKPATDAALPSLATQLLNCAESLVCLLSVSGKKAFVAAISSATRTASLVINVLTLISKRVEEGRSIDLSELMERILSDVKRLVAEASKRHDVGSSPVVAGRIRMRPGSTVTIAPAASSSG